MSVEVGTGVWRWVGVVIVCVMGGGGGVEWGRGAPGGGERDAHLVPPP